MHSFYKGIDHADRKQRSKSLKCIEPGEHNRHLQISIPKKWNMHSFQVHMKLSQILIIY